MQKNEIEKRFLELRQAHTAQQVYVQKLQVDLMTILKMSQLISL
jgi:hypothetical protein